MENNIIAVDFDGTLCENKYPEIGEPNTKLIDFLMNCQLNGDKVILWTCRNEEQTKAAVDWCSEGLSLTLLMRIFRKLLQSLVEMQERYSRMFISMTGMYLYILVEKRPRWIYGLKMRWSWLVNVRNLVMMATDFLSMAVLATEVH